MFKLFYIMPKKCKKYKRYLFSFICSFLIIPLLVYSVSAKEVVVNNINDFFGHLEFRSYDNYYDEFKWHDAYYFSTGSWSGMYEDTIDATLVYDDLFDDFIVEDDRKVMAVMMKGLSPQLILKKGSTLDINMEISFYTLLSYFQPTQIIFGLNHNQNDSTPFVYQSAFVNGYMESTEDFENFYGPDITEAWKATTVSLSFHYEPDVDTEYTEHFLQFIRLDENTGSYGYQFTNQFYCAFESLEFRYKDDETELISAIDQNTLKLINSLNANGQLGDKDSSLFDSLDNAEQSLLNSTNNGLLSFADLLGDISTNESNPLGRATLFLSSKINSLVGSDGIGFLSTINTLIAFGLSGFLLSLVGKAFKKE